MNMPIDTFGIYILVLGIVSYCGARLVHEVDLKTEPKAQNKQT